MKQHFRGFYTFLLIPLVIFLNCPVTAFSTTPEITLEIIHKPVKSVKAGNRTLLKAEVRDKVAKNNAAVDLIRVYFKALEGLEYNFIVLENAGNHYSGTLPAPANGAGAIEYLILVKNSNNQVFKSQNYHVTVVDDSAAESTVAEYEPLKVYTELKQAPQNITGFSDNMTVDVVESSVKLGVVAGLYSSGGAGVSSSGATSGGTVTATTGGFSTITIITSSVVAAAAVGAVAASSSSGGGDDSSSAVGNCPYLGNWAGSWTIYSCNGFTYQGGWNGTVNTSCYFYGNSNELSGDFLSGQINPSTGAATLSGVDQYCGPISGPATFAGNSVSGTFSGSGSTGSFSGARQ